MRATPTDTSILAFVLRVPYIAVQRALTQVEMPFIINAVLGKKGDDRSYVARDVSLRGKTLISPKH